MKRPPRFAVSSASIDGALALVEGAELHHMRNVMRLQPGTEIALFDERGAEYAGRIRSFDAGRALVDVAAVPARGESAPQIILAASIIKGPRMDFLVEKAAELGAVELWPMVCERSVVRDTGAERLARWRRLATAAAKQSLAPCAVAVRAPIAIEDLIRRARRGTLCVVLRAGARPLGVIVREARLRALLLMCGPEGDFTEKELAAARAAGFIEAGLGPRRLRSETAALAALGIAAGALSETAAED
jgi:16S rRNA (uracil1498-N3)-methyltransferase